MQYERRQQRKREVELLLDGEAPEMLDGRRGSEDVRVGPTGDDEPPVDDVAERGERITAEMLALIAVGSERAEGQDHAEGGQRGGHDAAEASLPEGRQTDPSGRGVLGEQQ